MSNDDEAQVPASSGEHDDDESTAMRETIDPAGGPQDEPDPDFQAPQNSRYWGSCGTCGGQKEITAGSNVDGDAHDVACFGCGGSGEAADEKICRACEGWGLTEESEDCPECEGSGLAVKSPYAVWSSSTHPDW
jgi:hypothetical protein